ncbi:MAG: protein-(glutamine-N5) methyltransferase, release factor-specific [Deltaproteobacteria bacterium RBG_16_48_10]|nr:MAG: protein-(glutamine-N5) methyltransferase, release factor-specific [Deltaproteobacteria bacterium RBG_16_48_10]
MTVMDSLNWVTNCFRNHGIQNYRLNAELLLARSLNLSREGLYIHLQDPIGEKEKKVLEEFMKRRISGEPLQYILGHQEFWSLDLKVDPRVLIPRSDTELLVEQALSVLSKFYIEKSPSVLEIGTGSGALAIALAREVGTIFLVATDISREALVLAKQNAQDACVLEKIAFVQGDIFNPFHLFEGREPFDLVLSNPPYIVRSEIGRLAREVKDFEPAHALDGGKDGMDFHRAIISQSPKYLRRGGWLLLEVGQGQAQEVSEMVEKIGKFNSVERIRDLSGIERVVMAKK